MRACVDCGAPTDRLCRLCPPCVTAQVDAELTAQGLPLVPSVETMERLARALGPRRVEAQTREAVGA